MKSANVFDSVEDMYLERQIELLRNEVSNIRRGLFGRYDKMLGELHKLRQDVDIVFDYLEHSTGHELKIEASEQSSKITSISEPDLFTSMI